MVDRHLYPGSSIAKQQGAALIMVLVISAVMGLLVVMMSYQSRLLVSQGGLTRDYYQAKSLVEDAESELLFKLTTSNLWLLGRGASNLERIGMPAETNFYGGEFEFDEVLVTLQDASGVLSILPLNEKLFTAVLLKNGISEEQAAIALDSLLDWMDPDDFRRLNGAEASDYNIEGFPRNDYIQDLTELRNIRGFSDEIYKIILRYASLFGEQQIVENYTPDRIVDALYSEDVALEKNESRRKSVEYSQDKESMVNRNAESLGTYPSRRLSITLQAKVGRSQFKKSFTIVRGMATKKPFFISEYQIGN